MKSKDTRTRAISYRVLLTCINILFPPLAVMMLCGAEYDCLLNCAFFLLAVIPSHVHGFYISCVYFHRRRKVRKGKYPGGPKTMIHSQHVLNGGASNAEVDRLWRKENGSPQRASSGRNSKRRTTKEDEMVQRHNSDVRRTGSMQRKNSNMRRTGSNASRLSNQVQGRIQYDQRHAEHVARDGYGVSPQLPQRAPSNRTAGFNPISPVGSNVSGSRARW